MKNKSTWFVILLIFSVLTIVFYLRDEKKTKPNAVLTHKKIIMYIKNGCSYCEKARLLLAQKNLKWQEEDITFDLDKKKEMLSRSRGVQTVPQIFIGSFYVGGYDDLLRLQQTGELDQILFK
jgi:glutaredoxin 3